MLARPPTEDETLSTFAARVLAIHARHTSPRTRYHYAFIFERHIAPALGDICISALSKEMVTAALVALLTERKLAITTIRNAHSVLRIILDYAVEERLLDANPAAIRIRALKMPRRKPVRVLNEAQLDLFLATAERRIPRLFPLFVACARGGLRIGEARALRGEDVDVPNRKLTIARSVGMNGVVGLPKSGDVRVIDMSRQLTAALTPYADRQGWVFPMGPRPVTYFNVRRWMRKTLITADLPSYLTPHSLRHSFGSVLVSRGVSLEYVRRQMGHSSIKITADLYSRHLPFPPPKDLDDL